MSVSEPSISQQCTDVPAQDINLKAYTAINLTQMIRRDLALNQDPLGQCSQLARTVRDTTISATAAGL